MDSIRASAHYRKQDVFAGQSIPCDSPHGGEIDPIHVSAGPGRDAYSPHLFRTSSQKRGAGAHCCLILRELANGPVLVGTWADAVWAIRFYEKYGFE